MTETRLNGVIRAFESGKPAFTCFAKLDRQTAIEMTDAPYDGIVYEMEHNPYDVTALGDCLQYMLWLGRARRDAAGAYPGQWCGDEPVSGQTGARSGRLRRDHAACCHYGAGL
jgi:hypothetical protein